ncbi:succinate dehydrogenase assembly factor [Chrysochromulina tobinii]|uniref:Succinate dehydrogenase assembly factor n=1 Tax=Chrysochromulina tobinii TaxID=1460289 RepID=A0A0M0JGY9_9EUKA|nr:succinate dehydrogenase assembly factor [Chrysochromulina tobinii]|eukprot:KOO25478.1 succinate dehydrogenase assembly factor [Chrysochromulina sp. CCMP291]
MLTRFMRGLPTVARSAVRSPANALLAVQMRWANQQAQAQSHLFADDDKLRRRLLYRSKQRGWLEMDIMLGDWAAANLQKLDSVKLQQFQEIIDMENPDLFRWLTGQAPIPAEMNNPVLRTLVEDLRGSREPKVSVRSAVGFEGKVWE